MKVIKVTELQKQAAMIVAAAVIMVIMGIGVIITPATKKAAQIRKEISQVGRKQDLLRKIRDLNARISLAETGLVQENERNTILSHLTTLANKNGLDVESVTPEPAADTAKTHYRTFLIKFKAEGEFSKLLAFIGELEKMRPTIAIDEMSLTQKVLNESGKKSPLLSVSLFLKTLLITGNTEKKA